jgi:hypothetical protein
MAQIQGAIRVSDLFAVQFQPPASLPFVFHDLNGMCRRERESTVHSSFVFPDHATPP